MNSYVGGFALGVAGQPTAGGINEAALTASALTILVGDGGAFASENQMGTWPFDANDPGQHRRHLSGNNFAFCDGHVKWYRPEKIVTTPTSNGSPTLSTT